MKNYILNLLVGVCAVSLGQVSLARADEMSQLHAQVQILSDAIDAHTQEFDRKSTAEAAFDHADYLRARKKYYDNMKEALQQFKVETLEVYNRFQPYFKVANSSYYSQGQRAVLMDDPKGPFQEILKQARVDYSYAFEILLIRAMGNIYYRVLTKNGGVPKVVYNREGYAHYKDTDLRLCNSEDCTSSVSLNRISRGYTSPYIENVGLNEHKVIQYNQAYLRKNLGCETFHCFALMKSDMSEVFISLWLEFGREDRKFYLDAAKTESFNFGLAPHNRIAGFLNSYCFGSCSASFEVGGRAILLWQQDYLKKSGDIDQASHDSMGFFYWRESPDRPDVSYSQYIWSIYRIRGGLWVVNKIFEPLITPIQ